MNKHIWIVLAALIVIGIGGALLLRKSQTEVSDVNIDNLDGTRLITQEHVGDDQIPDHFRGNPDAKVVVIEYEDFACVHCNEFSTDARKITEEYEDRVLFIYRHFNLSYPNSNHTQFASEAAFLTGGSDGFWGMFDLLWSTDMWTGQAVSETERKDTLNSYAEQLGLDVNEFNKKIDNRRNNGIQAKINRDKELGKKAGVTGTPTWFVNGEKVEKITGQGVRDALDKALESVED